MKQALLNLQNSPSSFADINDDGLSNINNFRLPIKLREFKRLLEHIQDRTGIQGEESWILAKNIKLSVPNYDTLEAVELIDRAIELFNSNLNIDSISLQQ